MHRFKKSSASDLSNEVKSSIQSQLKQIQQKTNINAIDKILQEDDVEDGRKSKSLLNHKANKNQDV